MTPPLCVRCGINRAGRRLVWPVSSTEHTKHVPWTGGAAKSNADIPWENPKMVKLETVRNWFRKLNQNEIVWTFFLEMQCEIISTDRLIVFWLDHDWRCEHAPRNFNKCADRSSIEFILQEMEQWHHQKWEVLQNVCHSQSLQLKLSSDWWSESAIFEECTWWRP